jgi:hypothetical protein
MTLTSSQTIATFVMPITKYKNIALLQKALLKSAVTTGSQSLAATRLISLLFDLDLKALLLEAVTPIDFSNPTLATQALVAPVQDLVTKMGAYKEYVRFAIEEARDFLPPPTVDLLNDYNTAGSPIYQVGVSILLVLATNLQVS